MTQVAGVTLGFALFGNALVNTTVLEAPRGSGYGLGESLLTTGLTFLPGAAVMVLCAQLAGWMIRRVGSQATLVVGVLICATAYVVRLFAHGSLSIVVVLFASVYAGTAFGLAALAVLVMECVPPGRTGAALGVNMLARLIGQSVFTSLFGAITGRLVVSVDRHQVASWTGLVVLSLLAMMSALVSAGIALGLRAPRAGLVPLQGLPEVGA